jgi:integrase/recombinase XerD
MATTIPSTALVPTAPAYSDTERLALAGFLAGYSGLTSQAYELDLRQFVSWCRQHQLHLFQVRRADIECFARDLEGCGRARTTITRRPCTVAGFIATQWKKNSLTIPRPRTSVGLGLIMSLTPRAGP